MSEADPKPSVIVAADAAELFRRAAELFAESARSAVAERERFTVAFSGGSTPKGLYELLAKQSIPASPGAAPLPWPATHVFFGDERYVPHDDPESNYRMAREALLDHVPIPPTQVHPIPTDAPDPDVAAAAYEETLRTAFGADTLDGWPRFDLVLLGLGPDGHTASLFPGTEAVHETRRLVVALWVEKFSTHRITLTPPVLCRARHVLFLVSGASKAETLRAVLENPYEPDRLPAQLVRLVDGELTWLVDRNAAAGLTSKRQTR